MQNRIRLEEEQNLAAISRTPQPAPALSAGKIEEREETQTAQAVSERLAEMRRRARRHKRRFGLFLPVVFSPLASAPIFLRALQSLDTLPSIYAATAAFGAAMMILPIALIEWFQRTGKVDTDELIRLGGLKAIGPLLEMRLATISAQDFAAIHGALIQLLPEMKASDANLLTARQRGYLYSLLQYETDFTTANSHNHTLCLAILKALEQIGDGKALPIVERLAEMKTRNSRRLKVKQAANDCLPLLRANYVSVDANRTLLRASAAVTAAPETLLRPAPFVAESAPLQLLRASASENAGGEKQENRRDAGNIA